VPPMGIGVENGYGVLVIEMGIVGLALWIIMSSAIVFTAWKVVRKLKGSPWFPLGFMIFWYSFLLLFPLTFTGIAPYQDFVLNAFLWLLIGILFRLPNMALTPELPASSSPENQPRGRMR
jgi:O-antigen ligase